MKRALMFVAVMALLAGPALAEEGRVPKSTLNALGLSGMQSVSDADGMEVRGMATFTASVKGTSVGFFQLLDPTTKNFLIGSSVNEVDGDAGPGVVLSPSITTLSKSHSVGVFGELIVATSTPPAVPVVVYSGSVNGFAGGFGSIILTVP